jgi:hypothetical protein
MQNRKLHILLILLFSLSLSGAMGQYSGATARLDSADILIGDRVKYELTVTVPKGSLVDWPIFGDTLTAHVEILRKSAIDTVKSRNDLYTLHQELFITSFDSGTYVIPPVLFKYRQKGDTMAFFTETEPIRFNVTPPPTDPGQDIKPLKPPLRAPVTLAEVLPWVGLALLLALAAYLIYYFFFRKKPVVAAPVTRLRPSAPPHVAALEALEDLRLKKLWQAGRVKEYYSEMTDIIREYIELRYPVRAMEMTTAEIETALRKTDANAQARDKLYQTLTLADLVKFAKEQPLPLENDLSLNHCIDFVRETRPSREEELLKPDSPVDVEPKTGT